MEELELNYKRSETVTILKNDKSYGVVTDVPEGKSLAETLSLWLDWMGVAADEHGEFRAVWSAPIAFNIMYRWRRDCERDARIADNGEKVPNVPKNISEYTN